MLVHRQGMSRLYTANSQRQRQLGVGCLEGGGMQNYWISFSKDFLGVPFHVASFEVRHARTPERARRTAELRLMRRRHLPDWRLCADALDIEPQDDRRPNLGVPAFT